MVTGMPKFHMNHEGVYQGCVIGKHVKGSFPSSERKTSNIIQLIQFDMASRFPMNSMGGCLYYVIFFYYFSYKTWIYFSKKKDEVFIWFLSFKALVENHTRNNIKTLRIDNGTKYEYNEFNEF